MRALLVTRNDVLLYRTVYRIPGTTQGKTPTPSGEFSELLFSTVGKLHWCKSRAVRLWKDVGRRDPCPRHRLLLCVLPFPLEKIDYYRGTVIRT